MERSGGEHKRLNYRELSGAWLLAVSGVLWLASCGGRGAASSRPSAAGQPLQVGVVKVVRKTLQRNLAVSSELVPFQQIDVYAKESGFVRQLNVDYGTHVRAGQTMAVLEIPELQIQLDEDQAEIKDAADQVARMQKDMERVEAQRKVTHLQFTRLDQVSKSRPGLVAQQEVDDWQGRDTAAEAQVEAAQSALDSAESQLNRAQARERHDRVIFDYSIIQAPFAGIVTKRYANLGTLMQSGINSTQALPLVQLSEDDRFRLVIPVPESYVPFVRVGDGVEVRVPSLNRTFPGRVARFSVDVEADTRTMHTEVDVPNPERILMPGMYAEATLALNRRNQAVAIPPEAVNIEGQQRSVWVIGPSGVVEKRQVTLGVETPNNIEVISGLTPGEMVAVGDRGRLKAGETVRPRQVQLLEYSDGTDQSAPGGN